MDLSAVNEDEGVKKELEELIASHQTSIKVVGVGGAGCNTVNRMMEIGIKGAELISVNTDAYDLLYKSADKKILIGKELTKGRGAGADPAVGEAAAKESEQDIKHYLQGADMVFICGGLGGGTGTGAMPVIAQIAKKVGALTVAVVTLPFSSEGEMRMKYALEGADKLKQVVDTLILIPNDKLLAIAPDLPIQVAFKVADDILINAVKGITEIVTTGGLMHVDFADIKRIMSNGGVAMISTAETDSKENKVDRVVEKLLKNPLLDVDLSTAKGLLLNVSGGPDLLLNDVHEILSKVVAHLPKGILTIVGAKQFQDLKDTIRVLAIITGVSSKQITGRSIAQGEEENKKEKVEEELGIKFL